MRAAGGASRPIGAGCAGSLDARRAASDDGGVLPDLESLRCFEAAAVYRSFRVAAGRVALSPAAFTDRIRGLEAHLGARLFERTTRRVALTAAGERLLPQARRALEEARRCAAVVREDARPPFSLCLGTRYELGLSWLVPALAPLRAERPDRTLHLYFGDGPDLLDRLERGRVDAFVASLRLTRADLDYALLHEEQYVMVGAPALVAERPIARPEDARVHVLLDTHPDLPLFRYFLDARPGGEVWAFGGRELLGTIAAIRLRALEGAGLAVLPRYFVEPDLAAERLVVLHPETPLQSDFFRLVWRRDHPLAEELRRLGDALRALPLR
jgi:DNA-binding transcriptional LysR family regulator